MYQVIPCDGYYLKGIIKLPEMFFYGIFIPYNPSVTEAGRGILGGRYLLPGFIVVSAVQQERQLFKLLQGCAPADGSGAAEHKLHGGAGFDSVCTEIFWKIQGYFPAKRQVHDRP